MLRAARQEKELSQYDVAAALWGEASRHSRRPEVTRYEGNQHVPEEAHLAKLAELLGEDLDRLLELAERQTKRPRGRRARQLERELDAALERIALLEADVVTLAQRLTEAGPPESK